MTKLDFLDNYFAKIISVFQSWYSGSNTIVSITFGAKMMLPNIFDINVCSFQPIPAGISTCLKL